MLIGAHPHAIVETYVIRHEVCRLTGRRLRLLAQPKITVGTQVKCSEDGGRLYIIDERGKEYRLRLVLQELMALPPPPNSRRP